MKQRITMKELSKKLNVSVGTVSKALSDSKEISEETKKRVRKLASSNHYIPNGVAKNLQSRKTKTIGVILPSLQSDFYAKALEEIIAKADYLGYKVYVAISHDLFEKEVESTKNFIERQIDGLIISFSKETLLLGNYSHLKKFEFYDIPVVQFHQISHKFRCDKIFTEDILYSKLAIKHLYKMGCRNIAYITSIPEKTLDKSRRKEYCKSLKEMNLKPHLLKVENEVCSLPQVTEFLISERIDGVIASDVFSLHIVIQNVLFSGMRIPQEISIINLADGEIGWHFVPAINTIDQRAKEQGALALETILKRINGILSNHPVEFHVKPKIIARESRKKVLDEEKVLKRHPMECAQQ